MKRRILQFFALFCVSLLLIASCHSRFDTVKNLDRATGETIIAFGDSLTNGYGVPQDRAFPSLLSDRLDVPILNRGVNGDTTADGLNRLKTDVIAENPWLVMVGLGGNDYLRNIPTETMAKNLTKIVTKIQDSGAIAVLLGMNLGIYQTEYKDAYRRIAEETGAYLIPDVIEGIIGDTEYVLDDNIHPNRKGHKLIADRIAEALVPLLDRAAWPPALSEYRKQE
jgi:acyl-CoA thioesterase-1